MRGSLSDWIEQFYASSAFTGLSDHTRGYIETELKRLDGALPGVMLPDVKKSDLQSIIDGVRAKKDKRGRARNGAANVTRKVYKRFFRWCEGKLDDYVSPAAAFAPLEDHEKDGVGRRVLTDDELRAVWRHGNASVRLLMLTGCRRNEIAYLRHSEIGKTEIAIPAERRKKVKGKAEPLAIHITPLMRSILDTLPTTGEYVMNGSDRPQTGFSKMKARLDEAVGFSDWKLHDMRRTLRTRLAALGFPSEVARKCVGQKIGTEKRDGSDKVYNQHDYKAEMAEAWEAYSRFIMKLTRDLKVAA